MRENIIRKILVFFLLFFISATGVALFFAYIKKNTTPVFSTTESYIINNENNKDWAEKKLQAMSLEEKISQLMMIRVYSNKDATYNEELINEIAQFQPGGVCFFQGSPGKQVVLTNQLQSVSHIPLLVAIDGEWGPAMRLDSCLVFPYQMTLGALAAENNELIYQMGEEVGKQCVALGIHINFAPCVDINNNSLNPVINFRSFGENRENVAQKSTLYMQGMQSVGVSASAKHFPGHGDTQTDSHHALPVINKSYPALDSLEFYPFKEIIQAGVEMVMISHLNVPSLDSTPNSIASLSKSIITDILIRQMNFNGIVITDAMDMKGLRNSYPNGSDAEIEALLAGVDILLLPNELKKVIPAIQKAVEEGIIPLKLINEKCLKILKLKQQKGLTKFKNISTHHLYEKLNDEKTADIIKKIEEKALTLLTNPLATLPLSPLQNTALLWVGNVDDSIEYQKITQEHKIDYYVLSATATKNQEQQLLSSLQKYDQVIVYVISKNQRSAKQYGITDETIRFVKKLGTQQKVILGLYSNPYLLNYFDDLSPYAAIFVGYKPTPHALLSGLKASYDELPFLGKLPVSTHRFPVMHGISTQQLEKESLSYSSLHRHATDTIDILIKNAIQDKIFPGCQILAIQNGNIVYHKNFGKLNYDANAPATNDNTLYDVASITKPLATTLAIMKLYEEGKIKLNEKIGYYLPYLEGSNKANLTIEELLTHTSGLPAFIPFYKTISKNGIWDSLYLNSEKNDIFTIQIADHIYVNALFLDTVQKQLLDCPLGKKKYLYSDLGFLFLKELVEELTHLPLDTYVMQEFYRPLGLQRTLFNPLKQFSRNDIAPTENDTFFRKQLIQGYVHDQTAAVYGGVHGNAGLFSTAEELAIILQMLMNGGTYNGKTFFSPQTIDLFTTTHRIHGCERRALGFETPNFKEPTPYLPLQADRATYGHFGFTGTAFWCDPKHQLIYIFLSNRVCPNVDPNLLSKSRLRVIIHEEIYKGLGY